MADITIKDLDFEIETLSASLLTLNENLRSDFDDYIFKKSTLFENKNIIKDSQEIINSVVHFEEDSNSVTQKLICSLNSEVKSICERLDNSLESYSFIEKLLELNGSLQVAHQTCEKDYLKTADSLISAKKLLDECSKPGKLLDFYKKNTEDYYKIFAELSLKSLDKWNRLVHFNLHDGDNKIRTVSLTVSSTDWDQLLSVYQALELLRIPYKETFCDNVFKDFVKPAMMFNCKYKFEKNNQYSRITIEHSLKCSKVNFPDIIDGLVHIFDFINESLDLKREPENGFIQSIGSLLADNFLPLFIDDHLSKHIPLKRANVSLYEEALQEINKLIPVLTRKGFISECNTLIKDYCCNVMDVFERKVCFRYKEIGTCFMKQDLHDIITIEATSLDYPMPDIHRPSIFSSDEEDYWNSILNLLNNDSRKRTFLQCQVSKSIYELVALIQDCLKETSLADETLTCNLQNTVVEIVGEYLLSPEIHRNLLDSIPQQSALIFSNTLYLIMKLVQYDKEFGTKNMFDGLIEQLQNMAFRELNKQIKIQEDIMISSLEKSGLQDLSELEVFPKSVEKSIRQCLRQVVLLQTVWMEVLPQDVYCIVIGRLLNKFVVELIRFILSATDISEDIANNIVDLFSLVNDKAPQVFPDHREVHRFVRSWFKLREVRLVLAGSLADINERWASGKGPLASELEPFEVKRLILALFQSSDIRQRTYDSIR